MNSPYATIIIPTHNRPHTLPASIRSAQRQSVQNIEIMIVGDGVDPRSREICKALAASDARINFVDSPKGERSGVVHRHNAVLNARGGRIFYNDDDDLLLPHHVERLGTCLDTCDFAESLPASVSFSRRIEVSLSNHSCAGVRRELAEGRLKLTYDTHVAHTRQAYLSLESPWLSRKGDIAGSFLAKFAASSAISWRSIAEVTALSFHGAARINLSDARRSAELVAFASLNKPDPSRLGFVWYLQFVRHFNIPLWDQHSSASTLLRLGFSATGESKDDPSVLQISFTVEQSQNIAALFKLHQRVPLSAGSVGKLMLQLSEPLQGGAPMCQSVTRLVVGSVGVDKAASALTSYKFDNPYDQELASYLMFFLLRHIGKPRQALQMLTRLDGRRCFHDSYRKSLLALD
jgi:hypothetical protein